MFLLLTAILILNAEAYKTSFGKCVPVFSQPSFDMEKMLGNWYVIEATSTGKRCLVDNFVKELGHPGHYLLTETFPPSSVARFFGAKNDVHRTGLLKPVPNAEEPGVMTYRHPSESGSYAFAVLSTDYEEYALVYACKRKPLFMKRWAAMILSRTPRLDVAILKEMRKMLRDRGIDTSSLSVVDHTHCQSQPEIRPDPIVPKLRDNDFRDIVDSTFVEKPRTMGNVTREPLDAAIDAIFSKPNVQASDGKELENTDEFVRNVSKEKLMANPLFIPF